MNRRRFLTHTITGTAGLLAKPATPAPAYTYRLRYAPRIGWLEIPVPRQLEKFAEQGFRAFEYNGLPRHPLSEAETFRKKMDELKMEMGVFVVNSGGWKGDALCDTAFHAGFLKDVRTAVEYHHVMGNRWATVCSGLAVKHLSFEQQTRNVVEGLKRAADLVAKTRLTLVLEPLNVLVDHAGYFVVRSDHGAEIIRAVGSPQVRLLFDMYHQQISEGNLIQNLRKHWDVIAYFQVGDVPGRKEPGTGEVNWQNVFRAIHQQGYTGLLGMEHGLSQPGEAGMLKCFEAYRQADSWQA
jgi:hydroxypyruvate isomerase